MSRSRDLPEGSVIFFPEGLPGFEAAQRFILLRNPEFEPVLLLQQADDDALSVPVIPAQFVDNAYKLRVGADDCRLLGFEKPPNLGDAVCLFVLVLGSEGAAPRCNLFAPIVINPAELRAKQVMQLGSSYPSMFSLGETPAGAESGSGAGTAPATGPGTGSASGSETEG